MRSNDLRSHRLYLTVTFESIFFVFQRPVTVSCETPPSVASFIPIFTASLPIEFTFNLPIRYAVNCSIFMMKWGLRG